MIRAASTKPFGFMPFFPGPGIGGHCIPADPMYLSWKARKVGFKTKMIDLAAKVNREMPKQIVRKVEKLLKIQGKKIGESNIFIVGVSYKKDVNDLRESPALDIIDEFNEKGVSWAYHDPLIPYLKLPAIKSKSKEITKNIIKKQDLVLLLTDHTNLDYKLIADNAKLVFDTRNIFRKVGIDADNVINL